MVELLANCFAQYYRLVMQCGSKKLFLAFALMVICLPAPAGAGAFSLDYSIGFNGQFQLDRWSPLSVVVENRGRETRAKLEVIVTSGSEYQGDVYRSVYAADVDLPSNSIKRYAYTINIKSFTHELIIRLRQQNDIIFSRSINLRSSYTEKSFAVVADSFVSPDILSVLPDHLYPANVRPKFLPETWYGYDSVKLLIMRANTLSQLSEKQLQALTRWLKQGGYLVLGGDLNYGSLDRKRLLDILPIRVRGYRQLSELPSLGGFCSRTLTGSEPFLVLNVSVDDAHVLAKENDTPIVIQKNLGFGQIVFLAFDMNSPPFSRWDGRKLFWEKIASVRSAIDRPGMTVDDQKVMNAMLAGMPLKFPDFRSGILFIGAYLIFLWFFLKQIKKPGPRRRYFSLGLLLMITVFTAVGYWGLYVPNLKKAAAYNSFCQLDLSEPGTPAYATYILGLYALKKLPYEIDFGAYSYPVTPILSERSRTKIPNPYVLQINAGGPRIVGSANRWSQNFYKLSFDLESPLAGYARQDNTFLTLALENKLPHNLVDCLIYYKRRFFRIDDIAANSHPTLRLRLATLKETEIFNDHEAGKIINYFDKRGPASYLRAMQSNLARDLLLEIHHKYQNRSGSMIFIGWVPDGLIRPAFNRSNPAGTGLTLVTWELPVEITS